MSIRAVEDSNSIAVSKQVCPFFQVRRNRYSPAEVGVLQQVVDDVDQPVVEIGSGVTQVVIRRLYEGVVMQVKRNQLIVADAFKQVNGG